MNKNYELGKINEFTYSLKLFGEGVNPMYKTIKRQVKSVQYDYETESIFFSAEEVKTLKDYLLNSYEQRMPYNICIKMIDELTRQMTHLKNLSYGFYGIDISDIMVVDDTFIFCSCEHLMPIIENEIQFYAPIKTPYFSNPEILKLTTLPGSINYKCSYYSLGTLVVFCFLKKYLLVGNEVKSAEEIENVIGHLNNTKLYWFIKRCLDDKIDKRVLLLI
jgi:hypothetical protein